MKVYVAKRGYNREGFMIIGIYTTESAAKKACRMDTNNVGDYHDIEEFELNQKDI